MKAENARALDADKAENARAFGSAERAENYRALGADLVEETVAKNTRSTTETGRIWSRFYTPRPGFGVVAFAGARRNA